MNPSLQLPAIKVPADLNCFPTPVLYILAEKEFQGPYDPALIQSTLDSLNKDGKVATSKYWPGTTHGFATRVDESVQTLKKARDEALSATADFFKAQL
jgi:dienelactone hydrolase